LQIRAAVVDVATHVAARRTPRDGHLVQEIRERRRATRRPRRQDFDRQQPRRVEPVCRGRTEHSVSASDHRRSTSRWWLKLSLTMA